MMSWFRRHPVSNTDLNAYADGALTGATLGRVTAHLDGCESCRSTLATIRQVKDVVQNLPRVPAPRSFTLSADAAAVRPAIPAPPLPVRYAFVPAAALAVLV